MVIRCECCAGRKKIVALGGIVKDCGNCKGVGYVASIAPDKTVVAPVIRVKRGRKPRNIDIQPAPFVDNMQDSVNSVSNIGVNDGRIEA